MDRLCDWVHRYNELGLQDPFDRPRRNGPVIALPTKSMVCVRPSVAAADQMTVVGGFLRGRLRARMLKDRTFSSSLWPQPC